MSATQPTALAPFPWQEGLWNRLDTLYRQSNLAHAYLLAGATGIGKMAFLRQFARRMLCLHEIQGRACGQCQNCKLSASDHPDILIVEPAEGARDISIEQIRHVSDFVQHTGHSGVAKIVLIDQAHRMNNSSANALLKTLEEPSRNTWLFLVSDLPGYLSATIRSRCQRIAMAMPSLEMASQWLQEYLAGDDDATALLAAVGCRPMHALELAASGLLSERNTFRDRLGKLLSGTGSPEPLVSQAMKIGPLTAIEYLLEYSSTLVKALASGANQEVIPDQFRPAGRRHQSLQALTRFYDESLQARRQLLSGANPNPQLVLESMLWRWSQLHL